MESEQGIHELDPSFNELCKAIIGAAIEVHKALGPGLLENLYEEAMCIELRLRGIPFGRQLPVPMRYEGESIGEGRLDLLVKERIVLELKSIERLMPIHTAQLLSYLKSTGDQLGLLINFNVDYLRDGIERIISSKPSASSSLRFSAPLR